MGNAKGQPKLRGEAMQACQQGRGVGATGNGNQHMLARAEHVVLTNGPADLDLNVLKKEFIKRFDETKKRNYSNPQLLKILDFIYKSLDTA